MPALAVPTDPNVLSVRGSVTGRAWVRRLGPEAERTALALAQRHSLSDVAARVLAGRGVTLDNADHELAPTIRGLLPDPSTLTDCDTLVATLADAVEAKRRIAIFADYDVDGATSAAVAVRTLRACGVEATITVPDRVTEGYGPSVALMRQLAEAGAQVVLTLDCGAGAIEPIAEAKALGLTVLVIDHHPVSALAPADAVVNPNRADDLSGLGACAAVGVTFVAMVGLIRELRRRGMFVDRPEPNLLSLLDCVALGTVADVVPLSALNRAFVLRGLTALRQRTNPGLAALASAARIGGPVAAHHLGFVLGPRINAGGRIGDSGFGARLLTTDDAAEAARIADQLEALNVERRALEKAAIAEAEALADDSSAVIVVAGDWHPGVVGLVASRLKDRYGKPAFAIALSGDNGVGSGRSIPGVDLGRAVRDAADQGLLIKGGGHAMAAGLTIAREGIGAFSALLSQHLAAEVNAALASASLAVDAVVAPSMLTEPFAKALCGFGPWGAGRPKPVFVLEHVTLEKVVPVGSDSLRLTLRGLNRATVSAMLFRASGPLGQALRQSEGQQVHLAVEVEHGTFRGLARAEVIVVDMARPTAAARQAA